MKHTIRGLFVAALAAMAFYSCNHSTYTPADSNQPGVNVDSPSTKLPDNIVQEEQQYSDSLAIASVLQQDANNASLHDGNDSLIAVGMRQIDLSKCPRDFAVAYVDHMHAWENAADIQEALNYLNSGEAFSNEFRIALLHKLLGNDDDPFADAAAAKEKLKGEADNATDQIHTTWNEVERVATAHNVSLLKK